MTKHILGKIYKQRGRINKRARAYNRKYVIKHNLTLEYNPLTRTVTTIKKVGKKRYIKRIVKNVKNEYRR